MTAPLRVISLDCESNGLGGYAFAAAATLSDDTGELDVWTARRPITPVRDGQVDPWVDEHVLPVIGDLPETVDTYSALLTAWHDWRRGCPVDALLIAHVAWPVEARFLLNAYAAEVREGPYPLIDVAPLLLAAGHDPTSVDSYLHAHGLPVPDGSPHHPLYDARAAETAFRHLMGRLHP